MSKRIKIAHLTSVHTRYDVRIFVKECRSLVGTEDFEVHLVVADGKGDETKDGVHIFDVGKPKGRLGRMLSTTRAVYRKALALECDLYHFHDPELLPVGLMLKKAGKKVVFDAHEDLPKQLMGKPYLHPLVRRVLAYAMVYFERYACRRYDAVVTATPAIRDKFGKINALTVDINNFPVLGELARDVRWEEKDDEVCYVGGITEIRGIKPMVRAMEYVTNGKLNLAGQFNPASLKEEVSRYNGWEKVKAIGQVGRDEVADILRRSKAGLVLFLPQPNHIDAQPNKMFEYMSAGIPVIGSHYPLWREIIEGNHCGVCVDPEDPHAIAEAINGMLSNPAEASAMGRNGKKAVQEIYNWDIEQTKLITLYREMLSK